MLSQVQSQLVAWAFYVAYFVGSIIFFLVSLKVDVLQKFDTKDIICWFITFCIWFFYVCSCSNNGEFSFLPYRFIYSRTWFSIQQIVANPLAIKMGLAGESTLWNYYWCYFTRNRIIRMGNDKTDLSLEDIKLPFIILGIAFIVVAIL
jgi:FHS family L-fucose permease-like MFS transporter